MPTLNEYAEASDQSGFYILANVGGSHPITLQVTTLGEQILQKAGYNSGNNVPTKVVWSMFDVGILYTSGTINEPPNVTEATDEIFRQLNVSNKLSTKERDQLLHYLEEYTGPNTKQIESLQNDIREEDIEDGERSSGDLQDDLDRLSRLRDEGDLTNEEYKLLKTRRLDNNDWNSNPANSTVVESDTTNIVGWLPVEIREKLVEAYRELIPDVDDPYQEDTTDDSFRLNISALPPDVAVQIGFYSPPADYILAFSEREQEERFREQVQENDSYEISADLTDSREPSVVMYFNAMPEEYGENLSDEDILKEIEHLLQMIMYVYDLSQSDIVHSKITTEAFE